MFGPYKLLRVIDGSYSCDLELLNQDTSEKLTVKQVKSKFQDWNKKKTIAESLVGRVVCIDTYRPDLYAVKGRPNYWFNVWEEAKAIVPSKQQIRKLYGPPGTGKTFRLISIVRQFIEDGGKPNQVGFFTYTNVAANVAIDRVLIPFPEFTKESFNYFSTLHSLATKIGGCMGKNILDNENLSKFDSQILFEEVWISKNKSTIRPEHPILDALSYCRNKCIEFNPSLVPSSFDSQLKSKLKTSDGLFDREKAIWDYVNNYKKFKINNNFVDFDDVIENAALDLDDSAIPSFSLLLVDEAQDLSRLQWKLVQRLIHKSNEIYIAGDDDQAIMEQFGASPEIFINLDVPGEVLQESQRIPISIFSYLKDKLFPLLDSQYPKRVKKQWSPTNVLGGYMPNVTLKFNEPGGAVSQQVTELKTLHNLLTYLLQNPKQDWLILAPTKVTCQQISNNLRALSIPHFHKNRPVLNPSNECRVRVQTIHTSKGDEAENVAVITLTSRDMEMIRDSRLLYVACTRAKSNLFNNIIT